MDENNRNFILAIVLSMVVLFGWQYFFVPKPKPGRRDASPRRSNQTEPGRRSPATPSPRQRGAAPASHAGRDAHARGSACRIAARHHRYAGAQRIDRAQGRPDRRSHAQGLSRDGRSRQPDVVLLSPAGGSASLLRRAWLSRAGPAIKTSAADRRHGVDGTDQAPLTQSSPVTLTYDNGKGLKFTRTISVDDEIYVHRRRQGRQ